MSSSSYVQALHQSIHLEVEFLGYRMGTWPTVPEISNVPIYLIPPVYKSSFFHVLGNIQYHQNCQFWAIWSMCYERVFFMRNNYFNQHLQSPYSSPPALHSFCLELSPRPNWMGSQSCTSFELCVLKQLSKSGNFTCVFGGHIYNLLP